MTFFEIEEEQEKCIKRFEEEGFKLFRYITVSGTLLEFHKETIGISDDKAEVIIYDIYAKEIVLHYIVDADEFNCCMVRMNNNMTCTEAEKEREKCIKTFEKDGFKCMGGITQSCTILEFQKEIPVPGGKPKTETIIYDVIEKRIMSHYIFDPNISPTRYYDHTRKRMTYHSRKKNIMDYNDDPIKGFKIEKEREKWIKRFEKDGFKLSRYITVSGTIIEFNKEIPVPDGIPKTEIITFDVPKRKIEHHYIDNPNKTQNQNLFDWIEEPKKYQIPGME